MDSNTSNGRAHIPINTGRQPGYQAQHHLLVLHTVRMGTTWRRWESHLFLPTRVYLDVCCLPSPLLSWLHMRRTLTAVLPAQHQAAPPCHLAGWSCPQKSCVAVPDCRPHHCIGLQTHDDSNTAAHLHKPCAQHPSLLYFYLLRDISPAAHQLQLTSVIHAYLSYCYG